LNFPKEFINIQKALQSCLGILGVEDGCIVRSKDEIDEYLFGDQSSFYYTDSARRFDALDMVLISGDSTILPWSHSAQKVDFPQNIMLNLPKDCNIDENVSPSQKIYVGDRISNGNPRLYMRFKSFKCKYCE